MRHKVYAGASGWAYGTWKPKFYPAGLGAKKFLGHYASRLNSVEVNYTFRTVPTEKLLAGWMSSVSPDFGFSVKANQQITHRKRLRDATAITKEFLNSLQPLREAKCLGCVLFQLPPNTKKDTGRLRAFLDLLSKDTRTAFEFRHETWFDDEVFGLLGAQDCALVVSDTDEKPLTEIISTAKWGYLRLRRAAYDDHDLVEWMKRVQAQKWKDAFVFFKHEDEGVGPKLAAQFLELAKS